VKCPICKVYSLEFERMIYDEDKDCYIIFYCYNNCGAKYSIALTPLNVAQLLWEKIIEKEEEER